MVKEPEKIVRFIFNIEESLRNEFKSVCALKGITMKEAIATFMKKEVELAKKAGGKP